MPHTNHLDDPVLRSEWFPAAWAPSVPPNSLCSARLLGVDVMLWRSKAGVNAWRDLCVHRGAKLSLGRICQTSKGECVACPYHGWEYNAAGECVHIPAHPEQSPPTRARVDQFAAREKYGMIWVCLGTPNEEIPAFPEGDRPEFRLVPTGPYLFHAQAPRIIENLLDVAHLPTAHAGLLGDPARAEIGDYSVTVNGNGIVAHDIPVWQPDPDGTGRPAEVRYTYWVERPFTARLTKLHGGQNFSILSSVTPVDAENSLAWILLGMNYAYDVPEDDLRRFQDQVTEQDIRIVNSQRPEMLPLDLQAELHLRSDQVAIAYRRWLRQLGLQYGIS